MIRKKISKLAKENNEEKKIYGNEGRIKKRKI